MMEEPDFNIRNDEDLKNFAYDILKTLQEAKEKKNISPTHVTRNDVMQYIQNRVKKALWQLEADNKISSTEAWSYENRFYTVL